MDMKNLRNATAGLALLLAASGTAFAEDTHHANQPDTQATPAAPGMFQPGMPMSGMQGQAGMMAMMSMMSQAGMTPMMAMMGPNGMMTFGMMDSQGQPAIMMSGFPNESMGMPAMLGNIADHIDGRIAYLKAELKITEAQDPLWNAFADALRSSAAPPACGGEGSDDAVGRSAGAAREPGAVAPRPPRPAASGGTAAAGPLCGAER